MSPLDALSPEVRRRAIVEAGNARNVFASTAGTALAVDEDGLVWHVGLSLDPQADPGAPLRVLVTQVGRIGLPR